MGGREYLDGRWDGRRDVWYVVASTNSYVVAVQGRYLASFPRCLGALRSQIIVVDELGGVGMFLLLFFATPVVASLRLDFWVGPRTCVYLET